MNALYVPDDIWVEIFQRVPPRHLAASVPRTCRRFRELATIPLLHHIFWLRTGQIHVELYLWSTLKASSVSLPRSLWIAPLQELSMPVWNAELASPTSPGTPLYNSIHSQLLLFTSLHTLVISNITLSERTYRVIELIPTLRTLKVLNSEYHAAEQSPTDRGEDVGHPRVQFTALPITHLHLHNVGVKAKRIPSALTYYHPLRLLTCRSLTSLAITWDMSAALGYRLHVHDPTSQNAEFMQQLFNVPNQAPLLAFPPLGFPPQMHLATPTHPRASPGLASVEVFIPCLKDDMFTALVSLTSPPPSALVPSLRVKIHVVKSALSEDELRSRKAAQTDRFTTSTDTASDLDNSDDAHRPLAVHGVWSYTGPSDVLDVFVPSIVRSPNDTLQMRAAEALGDLSTPLTHLCLRPPSVLTSYIVSRLERLRRPLELEQLEICVYHWDMEILFAIREICPHLVRLVVRYWRGTMDERFLIILGNSILPNLKHLHTIRLLHDPACAKLDPDPDRLSSARVESDENSESNPRCAPATPSGSVDKHWTKTLRDYLVAWDRYCPSPSLRRVQIGGGTQGMGWLRRWPGEPWQKARVEDVGRREEEGGSDCGWGDGSGDEHESWWMLSPENGRLSC